MGYRLLALVASVPLLLNVLSAVGAANFANAAVARAKSPCGQVASVPHYKHVIWIWMENHSFPTIIGSSSAPFMNKLATQCGLATSSTPARSIFAQGET